MKRFAWVIPFFLLSCNANDEIEHTEIETTIEESDLNKPEVDTPQNSDVKPGEYFEYHPSGGIKIRGFYNDNLKREGLWLSYYESGIKWSEAYYVDGKRDGHNITFYPNGKIRFVGEYKNDQKTGSWTFYDEDGVISKIENY